MRLPRSGAADDGLNPQLRRIERSVEERLQRLSEDGELSGLPGEGMPFAPDQLAGDDERWAAFRIMKNNGILPAWATLRHEIDAEHALLRRRATAHERWLTSRAGLLRTLPADRIMDTARVTAREDARVRAELRAEVRRLNELVVRHNAIVPAERLVLPAFGPDRLVPDAARAPDP